MTATRGRGPSDRAPDRRRGVAPRWPRGCGRRAGHPRTAGGRAGGRGRGGGGGGIVTCARCRRHGAGVRQRRIAADAQHVVAELVGRFAHDRRALPAVALTTDTSCSPRSATTRFRALFARQIEAFGRPATSRSASRRAGSHRTCGGRSQRRAARGLVTDRRRPASRAPPPGSPPTSPHCPER